MKLTFKTTLALFLALCSLDLIACRYSRQGTLDNTLIYYDYTSQIDTALIDLWSENDNDSSKTDFSKFIRRDPERQFVYYSTDSLISDMTNVTPVADHLYNATDGNSTLLLSFRLVKKGTLNPRIFQDVFHKAAQDPGLGNGTLREQLSAIILDFRNDNINQTCPNGTLIDYFKAQQISLTKYAKGQVGSMFGFNDTFANVKVGIQYRLEQLERCDYFVSQATHADFIVVTFDLKTISKSFMTLEAITEFKQTILAQNLRLLTNLTFSLNHDMKPMLIHFNLERDTSIIKSFKKDDKSGEVIGAIVEESQDAYFEVLENSVRNWLMQRFFNDYGYDRRSQNEINQFILSYPEYQKGVECKEKILNMQQELSFPFLFLHEGDVSQCALQSIVREMLQSTGLYGVTVNEYTWNAIVQLESSMILSNKSCPNSRISLDYESFGKVNLVLSDGVGSVWNHFYQSFETLLSKHPTAFGLKINTVIIPSKDLFYSVCGSSCHKFLKGDKYQLPRKGILKFVDELKERTNFSLGCIVDFGSLRQVDSSRYINQTTILRCGPILEHVGIVIWKFEMNFQTMGNFSTVFNLRFTPSSPKYKLLQILIARRQFMEQFPGTNVILQLHPDEYFFSRFGPNINAINNMTMPISIHRQYDYNIDDCFRRTVEIENYFKTFRMFSYVHKVPMMLRPMYDVKHYWYGSENLPRDDGSRQPHSYYNCHMH